MLELFKSCRLKVIPSYGQSCEIGSGFWPLCKHFLQGLSCSRHCDLDEGMARSLDADECGLHTSCTDTCWADPICTEQMLLSNRIPHIILAQYASQ